jgi:ferritin-like metal-binding protein YciE
MTKKDQLIYWLGDAHALEVGLVTTLEKQIAEAKGLPKVSALLTKHLAETKKHATAVKNALESLGGSHPVIQEGVSKLANLAAGVIPTLAKDTVIKNAIAGYTSENMEIACYKALIATANALGEKKIAATCEAILKDEQAMANALDAQLPGLIATYLGGLDDDRKEKAPKAKTKSAPKESAPKASAAKKAARPAAKPAPRRKTARKA